MPLNGSSVSQVIGRGGCDSGLLGHACACACWAACLIWWQWDTSRRKHSLSQWQEQGAVLFPLPAPPLLSSLCPGASRLREKHCSETRALGTSLRKVISRALERKAVL